jgi:HD-GYP domain-containing protein (c-di-GMP phosphodiesterase class II)
VLLLAAGQSVASERQLRRLREAAVTPPPPPRPATPPPDLLSETVAAEPLPTIAEEHEVTSHALFRPRIERALSLRRYVTEATDGLLRRVATGGPPDMPELVSVSSRMAGEVAADPYAIATLTHLRQCDDYTIEHSADVAILMVAIGRVLGYPEEELRLLALAGLMHDVGKQRVPAKILRKPGGLTEDEFAVVRRHPEYGAELLECAGGARGDRSPQEVLAVVLEHHERLNGSGYPNGAAGDRIHAYSRIAAVADTFDAMTAERIYRKGTPAREAVLRLYAERGTLFDPQAVTALVKLVGVYPVGTRVRLNTGERGVVVAPNPLDSTRAVVEVDHDRFGRPLSRPFRTSPRNVHCWIVGTT